MMKFVESHAAQLSKVEKKKLSQGSYGSWKTWKIMGIYFDILQDWKVLEKDYNRF